MDVDKRPAWEPTSPSYGPSAFFESRSAQEFEPPAVFEALAAGEFDPAGMLSAGHTRRQSSPVEVVPLEELDRPRVFRPEGPPSPIVAKPAKRPFAEQLEPEQEPGPEEAERTRQRVYMQQAHDECMDTQRIFDYAMSTATCELSNLFFFDLELGKGASGRVYLARINHPELKELVRRQGGTEPVAVKLQTITDIVDVPMSDEDRAKELAVREALRTEIAINRILMQSWIPAQHYVRSFWWKRIITMSGRTPEMFQLEVFEYANHGTLSKLIKDELRETVRSRAVVEPLDRRVLWIQAVWASIIAQIFVGLELIRAVMPDFNHGDLHYDNVLCQQRPMLSRIVYDIGGGVTLTVPLMLTNYCIMKLSDMGFASGSYVTADGVSHAIGKNRLLDRIRDHTVAHEELRDMFLKADVEAWLAFSRGDAYRKWDAFQSSYVRVPSYAFVLATQPLFQPLTGANAALTLQRALGLRSALGTRDDLSLAVPYGRFTEPLQSQIVRLPVASVQHTLILPCNKCGKTRSK